MMGSAIYQSTIPETPIDRDVQQLFNSRYQIKRGVVFGDLVYYKEESLTIFKKRGIMGYKCCVCGETDKFKFYTRPKSRCKVCHLEYVKERHRRIKRFIIKELGVSVRIVVSRNGLVH